jgi:hypothetical protein
VSVNDLTSSPVGVRMLDDLVGHGFATRPLTELSEAELYTIVAAAADEVSATRWTDQPTRSFPWEQRISREAAKRLARAIPTCAAARWWSGGVVDRPQVWLGALTAAPVAGRPCVDSLGTPPTALWTSSAVTGIPSAWWPAIESGTGGRSGARSIWQVNLQAGARVFEVHGPDDWRALCESFPGREVDGWVVPDWSALSEQFDGIHLTVEGLIRTQGVEVETDRGPAMLQSWDAESTAWLRWSFTSVERLGSIRDPSHEPFEFSREVRRGMRRARRSS